MRSKTIRRQLARFATVGLINTGIDLMIFSALYYWVGLPLILANTLGYCSGTVNGFFMNKYWTFSESSRNGHIAYQLPLYFLLYSIGLALSNLTIWLLAPFMPIVLAKIWAIGASLIWNFWSSRRFVYLPVKTT